MSELILKLTGINKSFRSGDGAALQILKDLSFSVDRGKTVAITGPSGCGKSTLLNLIGTLEPADSGDISIEGKSISGLKDKELAEIRLSKIGFVFQKHHLMPQLSALENVLLPTLKSQAKDSLSRALELLEKVGLKERVNHRPGQLSGGECQRVALCRALINKPSLLLADEPTGALDKSSSKQLTELLLKLNKEEELTLILVSHSAEVAALMEIEYKLQNGTLEKL